VSCYFLQWMDGNKLDRFLGDGRTGCCIPVRSSSSRFGLRWHVELVDTQ
jgi:hypothetical protein